MRDQKLDRRTILAGLAGLGVPTRRASTADAVQQRVLGRTGQKVSSIGLGGSHIGKSKLSDDESIRLIREAIDRGLTFMDNSWDYNGGQSEIRMGKALRDGYRDKAFLMTKFDGRTKEAALSRSMNP
jgi:aryl-alcohol dehydrogenase-like predicted oxidoreductase